MAGHTFVLTVWESMELLEDVLIQHFTEEKESKSPYAEAATKILAELESPRNYEYLVKHSSDEVSGDIAPKLKAKYARISKKDAKSDKVVNFAKLVYTIGQFIKKGLDTYLNEKQLEVLHSYLDRPIDRTKFRPRQGFTPKYHIREKFKETIWIIYTWDYSYEEDGTKKAGIRQSILKFNSLFRVKLDTYRNREEKFKSYAGDYIIMDDYIKIRFAPYIVSDTREDDLSFLFYVGKGNFEESGYGTDISIDLAIGQYRSLDCGSLQSGTAVMRLLTPEESDHVKPSFTTDPSKDGINNLIINYLKDRGYNYIKSPEKVNSIGNFNTWARSQKRKNDL